MNFIEAQRAALEELNILEKSITERLIRFPYLLSGKPDSRITKKLILLQQHELKFFIDQYQKVSKSLKDCIEKESLGFTEELKSIKETENGFKLFDKLIRGMPKNDSINVNTAALYQPYSSNKEDLKYKINKKNGSEKNLVKRKYLLSSITSFLYGDHDNQNQTLDLRDFHDEYKKLTNSNTEYIEYLYNFNKFPYRNIKNLAQYNSYLEKLYGHLEERLHFLYPLNKTNDLVKKIKNSFEFDSNPIKENEKGEVFCEACDKLFAKLSVYNGHLNGKKHQKHAKFAHEKSTSYLEFLIIEITKELKQNIEYTVTQYEKHKNQSEREKFIEAEQSKEIEEEYTAVEDSSNSEDEYESDDDDNFKHLPLGNDGTPIPFWLYKLQGLNKLYNCEVCGNVNYKGMKNFEMHFNLPKHQNGLKLLGVEDSYIGYFKNISTINEVEQLNSKLSRQNKLKTSKEETIVEVEDDEGNVMSEKDYTDLKKQGLL